MQQYVYIKQDPAPVRRRVWELIQSEGRVPTVAYISRELCIKNASVSNALRALARDGKLVRGEWVRGRRIYSLPVSPTVVEESPSSSDIP